MIDHATIERILDVADIEDVIQDFITLKRRGVNYIGLCPFHNEKTPSFTVSPSKGIYKCFGCGKGGNSVNFIMEHENLSYPEALKFLAKKYNIDIVEKELTDEEVQQRNERESLMVVSAFAQKYFTETLHNHKQGKAVGLSYFRERGFRDDIIEKFQLGYCLDMKDAFTQEAIRKGYKLDYLVLTGLTIQRNTDTYDRFKGRILFPIHGLSGNVIGFGGRTLSSDKKIAKYLNSPESLIYHKSKVLYGLFQAKKSIVQNEKCFLVEGYTDVTSLHQAGIENVVASSGTSLTVEQIRLIKRFTKNITILYDGDDAGIKASLRGIDLILEEGMNVKILLFPDGEDPDSYSKKISSTELHKFIEENEKDFITFKAKLLLSDAKNDPVKRANLISDIVRSVSVIPDSIIRSEYIKECSNMLKVSEQQLYTVISKRRREQAERDYRQAQGQEIQERKIEKEDKAHIQGLRYEHEEKEIIRLLVNYATSTLFTEYDEKTNEVAKTIVVSEFIINEIRADELTLTNPLYKQIFEECEHLRNENIEINNKYFINHPDIEVSELAADLFSKKYSLSKIHRKGGARVETEDMKLHDLIPKAIFEYKNKLIVMRIKDIEQQMKVAQENQNHEEFVELQVQFIALTHLKIQLSSSLGGRTIVS